MSDESVSVTEFVRQVQAIERITIEVSTTNSIVTAYRFERPCNEDQSVGWWLDYYIRPHLPKDAIITVYNRVGKPAGKNTLLKECRPV